MATTYIVQILKPITRTGVGKWNGTSRTHWWNDNIASYTYNVYIPNVPGISSVKWAANYYLDRGDCNYSSSCYIRVKKGSSIIAEGVSETTLSVSPGDHLTVEVYISVSITGSPQYYGQSNMSVTYDNMRFITAVTLPTISQQLKASDVNTLATVMGTGPVSQGGAIARSPVAALGNATGNLADSWYGAAIGGSTSIDTTKPLKSNIDAVVTRMTNRYIQRSTINPS